MGSNLIIATCLWADTSAEQAWPLLADAAAWPQWWHAIAQSRAWPADALHTASALPWRALLGRPLRLAVATLAAQPRAWLTLRLEGDLQGQATFTLEPAAQHGLSISCRCELQAPRGSLSALAPWFERRVLRLLQSLGQDFGLALSCRIRLMAAWQGSAWRR